MRYYSSSKLSGSCAATRSIHSVQTPRGRVSIPRVQSKCWQPARRSRCIVHDAYAASFNSILQNEKHPAFVPEQEPKVLKSTHYGRHHAYKSFFQSKSYNGVLREDSLVHEAKRSNLHVRNSFGPLVLRKRYATSAVSRM